MILPAPAATSRLIQLSRYGDATQLQPAVRVLAPLADTAVRVRQQVAGVNYVDVYHRQGRYPLPLPGIPGVEGSGVIEAAGARVATLQVGQRVAWVARSGGGYAEHVDLDAARAIVLPDEVSLEQAGAGMLRSMTSYLLLEHYARLRRGQTVLVHAAAGGLGLLLTQWAKGLGARVIGTVSSDAKAALAQAHGLDHALDYRNEDVVAAVRALTDGEGADVVIDGIGGQHVLRSIEATRSGGMAISIGAVSGDGAPGEALAAAQARGVLLERPSILGFTGDVRHYRIAADAALARLRAGLRVAIADRLPLEDAAKAHRLLEAGAVQGALLLTP
ncbi:zinc-binding dehydrogenase [Xanthomonas bundabergensis]|uniref:zinc-binding dehydrogenase n=1 Tax=Xanthomonas bundabergensis TaxID=3160842 RepID=UPI00351242EC